MSADQSPWRTLVAAADEDPSGPVAARVEAAMRRALGLQPPRPGPRVDDPIGAAVCHDRRAPDVLEAAYLKAYEAKEGRA